MKNEKPKAMGKDVAEKELERWFDFIKVDQSLIQSEDEEDDIIRQKLISSFVSGQLSLKEDGQLVQKLIFPVEKEGGELLFDELIWKTRYRERELAPNMKGVKPTDVDGKTIATICTLTGKPKGHINAMYNKDSSMAKILVNYFLI